jgi:hypothetical protein
MLSRLRSHRRGWFTLEAKVKQHPSAQRRGSSSTHQLRPRSNPRVSSRRHSSRPPQSVALLCPPRASWVTMCRMKNQIGNPNLIRPPPRSTKCFTQFARRSGERCWELSNTTTRAQRPHFCTLLALRHSQEIWSDPVKRPRNGQGTKKVASSSQKSSFPGVPQPLPLSSERDVQSGHVCQALPNSYRRRATRGQWNALEQRQEPRW